MSAEAPPPAPVRRRSGSQRRRKTAAVRVPCLPSQRAQLDELAARSGQSLGALCLDALLAVPLPPARRVSPDLQTIGRMLAELGAVKGELGKTGSNLNQIAHQLNLNTGRAPLTERSAATVAAAIEENHRAHAQLTEMWTVLMELGGRRSGSGG